jgi:hypothetical protein
MDGQRIDSDESSYILSTGKSSNSSSSSSAAAGFGSFTESAVLSAAAALGASFEGGAADIVIVLGCVEGHDAGVQSQIEVSEPGRRSCGSCGSDAQLDGS